MDCITCRASTNKPKITLPCDHTICSLCMYKSLPNKEFYCCSIYKISKLPHIWYLGTGNHITKNELTDLLPNEIESLKNNFEIYVEKINDIPHNNNQKILIIKGNIIFIGTASHGILSNAIAIERYSGKIFISNNKELSELLPDTILYRII